MGYRIDNITSVRVDAGPSTDGNEIPTINYSIGFSPFYTRHDNAQLVTRARFPGHITYLCT